MELLHEDGYCGPYTSEFPQTLGEQLFADQEGKDVRLVATDGDEYAHSAVLSAASPAFRGMLAHSGLVESKTKVVQLPDTTKLELRIWLRLLYTGQVNEDDWQPPAKGFRVTLVCKTEQWPKVLSCGCTYLRAGAHGDAPMFKTAEEEKLQRGGRLFRFLEPDGQVWKLSFTAAGADVPTVFTQRGGSAEAPPTGEWTKVAKGADWGGVAPPIGPGLPMCEALTVTLESEPNQVPLSALLGSLRLSRKYVLEHMANAITKVVQSRLTADSFEEILATAIKIDHVPMRMFCLRFAEGCQDVRTQHNTVGFATSEVTFELRQLWPEVSEKRRRFL
ncbi:unnamed protein product [Polarella glacialis]|uniref:BTB domain-containing protein n=1 Tax=Polarella glacialis TaxID=89957 RepID=A0A813LDA0_POLGL|nr:unnamed protein product [Polarella glacialis]